MTLFSFNYFVVGINNLNTKFQIEIALTKYLVEKVIRIISLSQYTPSCYLVLQPCSYLNLILIHKYLHLINYTYSCSSLVEITIFFIRELVKS